MTTTKTCAEKGASWAELAEFPGWSCQKRPNQRMVDVWVGETWLASPLKTGKNIPAFLEDKILVVNFHPCLPSPKVARLSISSFTLSLTSFTAWLALLPELMSGSKTRRAHFRYCQIWILETLGVSKTFSKSAGSWTVEVDIMETTDFFRKHPFSIGLWLGRCVDMQSYPLSIGLQSFSNTATTYNPLTMRWVKKCVGTKGTQGKLASGWAKEQVMFHHGCPGCPPDPQRQTFPHLTGQQQSGNTRLDADLFDDATLQTWCLCGWVWGRYGTSSSKWGTKNTNGLKCTQSQVSLV